MLLNNKAQTPGGCNCTRPAGLGSFLEVALGAVFREFPVGHDTLRGIRKE
jgi:hypothetical protein